jgi:hypothetical protein
VTGRPVVIRRRSSFLACEMRFTLHERWSLQRIEQASDVQVNCLPQEWSDNRPMLHRPFAAG